MIVRPADRADLVGVGRVVEKVHWTSYDGLLRPDTIGRVVARDHGPSRIARRLLRGGLHVVTVHGEVVGFCDGVVADGSLVVEVLAVEPEHRRRGVGRALLAAVSETAGAVPASTLVLLGNLEGEGFYEANGFVPGEIVESLLFDEAIVERRWLRERTVASPRPRQRAVGG